jgi:hypothetical protein
MRRIAVCVALLAASACHSSGRDGPHDEGQESFVSSAPGGGATPITADSPEDLAGSDTGASTRAIAEADLYARAGDLVLVQNAWRGLQVVDVADPARPLLLARVPLEGQPVGLYLRGTVALVVARDHVRWALDADGQMAVTVGSRLWAVDLAQPAAPIVRAEIPIAGAVEETRIVGDVLYLVTRTTPTWVGWPMGMGVAAEPGAIAPSSSDALLVASVDVSDPAAPAEVAQLELPADGWNTHANVTPERITLARSGWDASGLITRLTAVDISDPAGALVAGAEMQIAGMVRDRWALDLDAASGTFRAIAQDGWNLGARLHVLDWATPGTAAPLAELSIDVREMLTAARFDGATAYVVTALAVDPLWVIDLRKPSNPRLAGQLEMPGQLDFVEPRGDRLLALGHTAEAGSPFQLHVSLLDVADPDRLALLARVPFGPDWGFVPANPDDLRKAFQILDDRGLLLVPYQGFDRGTWRWRGGTQLLAFGRDTLGLRGFVSHAGAVKRAFPLEAPGLLAALSDESLQTIDASDPVAPVELGAIDLARSVADIAVVGAAAAEVSGEWWLGSTELTVVPASDPDATTPVARFPLAGAYARLFRVGTVAWVLARDPWTGATTLEGFDLADPAAPARRGRLTLADTSDGGWGWSVAAELAGETLAVERITWSCDQTSCSSAARVLAVDLRNPDAPRLAGTVEVPSGAWTGGLMAVGTSIWYSQYEWENAGWTVRYYVGRVDLSDPDAPRTFPRVNVPGTFFSASDDGSIVYTEEFAFPASGAPSTWLHALALTDHGTARLLESVELPGVSLGAVRAGAHAYAVVTYPSVVGGAGSDEPIWWSPGRCQLVAVSLADLAVTGGADLPWARILRVAGGKLFLAHAWPDPSIAVYGLGDPGAPAFEQAVRTSGWVYDVVVEDGVAYLPSGRYGVPTVRLAP